MNRIFEKLTRTYVQKKEYEKALAFCEAYERLLSVFDGGCPDFYVADKIFVCEYKAQIYMKTGSKEKCFSELEKYAVLA